jgi:hypothetical protein
MVTRLLLIFFLVSQFCYGQNPPLFNPHIYEYKGYVTVLSFKEGKDWYFVNLYSTFKPKRIRFKFKDGKITIDERYKIVFWGNHIPDELFSAAVGLVFSPTASHRTDTVHLDRWLSKTYKIKPPKKMPQS